MPRASFFSARLSRSREGSSGSSPSFSTPRPPRTNRTFLKQTKTTRPRSMISPRNILRQETDFCPIPPTTSALNTTGAGFTNRGHTRILRADCTITSHIYTSTTPWQRQAQAFASSLPASTRTKAAPFSCPQGGILAPSPFLMIGVCICVSKLSISTATTPLPAFKCAFTI